MSRTTPSPSADRRRGGTLPLLLSCEHGGNAVPAPWRAALRGAGSALSSHRGHDLGAAELARALARELGPALAGAPLVHRATRLLVDVNRSADNPAVFSRWTAELPDAERARLLATLWAPHRARVRAALEAQLARRPWICHVGVHSFTPVLRGERRAMHVGLLYDPRRARERALAERWRRELLRLAPRLVVQRNAPYRGDSDGLTTRLRRELGPRYLGLELEVRSDRLRSPEQIAALAPLLAASLRAALVSFAPAGS